MINPKPYWTGERLETFINDQSMLEHLHRYSLTFELIKNKKVLDIACGEGYGVNLMSNYANHVTGIDIDKKVIRKANQKYTNKNIKFIEGSILNIPSPNNSFDIVICFETLEHVEEHELLISEIKRVLKHDGLLIISTPDKINYSNNQASKNPFHKKELTGTEFKYLINKFFKNNSFFQQSSYCCSIIQNPEKSYPTIHFTGNYNNIESYIPTNPYYWISIASDNYEFEIESSLFHHKLPLTDLLRQEGELVKQTYTYKIGHLLLSPFKLIKNIFYK